MFSIVLLFFAQNALKTAKFHNLQVTKCSFFEGGFGNYGSSTCFWNLSVLVEAVLGGGKVVGEISPMPRLIVMIL